MTQYKAGINMMHIGADIWSGEIHQLPHPVHDVGVLSLCMIRGVRMLSLVRVAIS